MPEILKPEVRTVGEAVDATLERLLDGVLSDRSARNKTHSERIAHQRHAATLLAEDLQAIWCPDKDTLFADVRIPTRRPDVRPGDPVPFFNVDQPLVTQLCEIIRKQAAYGVNPQLGDPALQGLYERITA